MSEIKNDLQNLSPKKRELYKLLMDEKKAFMKNTERITIPVDRKDDEFPLSYAQQRIWFMEQLVPFNTSYNIPSAVRLEGRLDSFALEKSLNEIIRRHESLMTVFMEKEGAPVQVVIPDLKVTMAIIDIQGTSKEERQVKIHEFVATDNQKPHNLLTGPLIRATLLRFEEKDHALVLNMHHIISDGWSMRIFMQEMAILYEAFIKHKDTTLAKPAIQYIDYALWQKKCVENGYDREKINYWKGILNNGNYILNLPFDYKRPPLPSFRGSRHYFEIPEALTALLVDLANQKGNTLFMLLMSAFKVLLYRYTGQEDIVIGTPVAGRTLPELETLIGFFVNMLALRSDFSGNPTFDSYLETVRKMMLEVYTNQDIPFEVIVEEIQPERDLSRNPLFQVVFGYQSEPAAFVELPGLTLNMIEFDSGTARFDLELQTWKEGGKIKGYFEYSSDLFNNTTIMNMSVHFLILLNSIVKNPLQTVQELPILSQVEKNDLLTKYNPDVDYSVKECIHQLFEKQAEITPDAVAVVFRDETLTYADLNSKANILAQNLMKYGAGPGKYVGLYVERSIEMVIAILAVVKAGGAYVPIDPSYPVERLTFILEDSRLGIVLTYSSKIDLFADLDVIAIMVDREYESIDDKNPCVGVTPQDPAYVIYTSGSTGKPKGVIITHNNLTRLFEATNQLFHFNVKDVWTMFHSYAFDFSVWELWGALIYGGRLIVVSYETSRNPKEMFRLILEEGVTVLNQTPSFFKQLIKVQDGSDKYEKTSLRYIIFGGEALDIDSLEPWFARYGDEAPRLVNMYGITETTVHVTYRLLSKADLRKSAKSVIGHPIPDLQVYLLDKRCQPVPVGIPGEIYVGGAGVASGYLNRAELTSERFIPNPFCSDPKSRLYKSGDLARFLHNGELEYLGRMDQQVKIRGYRIELGEIESLLIQLPQIHSAVVTTYSETPDEKRLTAYIQYKDMQDISIDKVRGYLREQLPEYMIPSYFVVVDRFPITINGKLDYNALPDPKKTFTNFEVNYQAPRFELEKIIAGIWQEVLNIDRVGINDNFFDLGGHSMLMAQVYSQLRKKIHREIKMIDLFKYTTVSTLANYLNTGPTEGATIHNYYESAKEHMKEKDSNDTDIAIIAMSLRFPGANSPEEFWQNLRDGVETISFFTEEEVLDSGVSLGMVRDPNYVKADGILEGIEYFDASFFGYSPREAEMMDPQQRIFLECAWEAIERAGYDPGLYKGKIGAFVSSNMSTYLFNNIYNSNDVVGVMGNFQVRIPYLMGNDKDFLATRLAYKLNLQGPAVSVQTACSSTMVGTHLASRCLINRECDMVLVGGVTIKVPQKMGYLYQEGGVPSPDGHTRSFDADGKGAAPGNGVGMVVLKRLQDAIDDGDNIYAVIKGTAMNNDGSLKAGFTAPSVEGQSKVIADALAVSGIEPETITYIEANGTATQLGDAMEVDALTQIFHENIHKNRFCGIGSVKTNIGHLDTANGIAGLIKTALAIKHRMIPPSLNFKKPNPNIDFGSTPFYVNTALKEWDTSDVPIRAGVNSFGIGGTNVHAVLQEGPEVHICGETRPLQLLLLSAKTETALQTIRKNLSKYLSDNSNINIADVAYTLKVGRKPLGCKMMAVYRDIKELSAILEKEDIPQCYRSSQDIENRQVVFVFSKFHKTFVNKGRELYSFEPLFRNHLNNCCEIVKELKGIDLLEVIYPRGDSGAPDEGSIETDIVRSAVFCIGYALARLMISWGIKPEIMVGEGVCELTAACISGVMSPEDALLLINSRENDSISRICLKKPVIPFISNNSRTYVSPSETMDHDYWMSILRNENVACKSYDEIIKNANSIFIEIGMKNDFHLLNENNSFGEEKYTVLTTLPDTSADGGDFGNSVTEIEHILDMLGRCWMAGIKIDWYGFYSNETRRRLILPTYPFERQRYWIDSRIQGQRSQEDTRHGSANPITYYARPNLRNEYIAPGNEMEQKIADVWRELLGIDRIGVYDDFIDLGGDSIKALQMTSRLRMYGLKLSTRDIFKYRTIIDIYANAGTAVLKDRNETVIGEIGLTPIQKWFFSRNCKDIHYFNQAVILYCRNGFKKEIVEKVFCKIVEHHDILRANFKIDKDHVLQINRGLDERLFDIFVFDLEDKVNYEYIEGTANGLHSSMRLEEGPLVKLALFKTHEGDHLLITIHHLIVDGISWRIIFEDFAEGYRQEMSNSEIVLQSKTDSYRTWSEKLGVYSNSKGFLKEIEYWSQIESSAVTPLRKDNFVNVNLFKDIGAISLTIPQNDTRMLLQDVNKAYNTEINDILLTALGYAFKEWSGENRILIGLEGHGREEIIDDMDISRTVGWFTTIYPAILNMDKSDNISYQIKSIKEMLRHIPDKGIGYGILKYLTAKENKKSIEFKLEPEIVFNYQGQFDQDINTGIFTVSHLPAGSPISPEMERSHSLDINGMVIDEKLVINFSYNKNEYFKDSINSLVESFSKHLHTIISHCIGKENTDMTPSDFSFKGLDFEEMERVFDILSEKLD